jgi:excisionase family DNA binding protein
MATNLKTGRALMDLPAVAERLGVGERHVRRLVYERRIPFIKWGHLLRFDPDEVDAWIDESRQRPVSNDSSPLRLHRP